MFSPKINTEIKSSIENKYVSLAAERKNDLCSKLTTKNITTPIIAAVNWVEKKFNSVPRDKSTLYIAASPIENKIENNINNSQSKRRRVGRFIIKFFISKTPFRERRHHFSSAITLRLAYIRFCQRCRIQAKLLYQTHLSCQPKNAGRLYVCRRF